MQMLIASTLSVRGGIAFDEKFVDEERWLFLDPALTTAYELEQNQDSIGAAIDGSVGTAIPDIFRDGAESLLVNALFPAYDVPMTTVEVRALFAGVSAPLVQSSRRSLKRFTQRSAASGYPSHVP